MRTAKIYAKDVSDKGQLSKICRELFTLNSKKKQTILLKNEPKPLIDTAPRKIYRWQKSCCISHVIKEMQTKRIRYPCTPIRMTGMQNTDNTKCWQGCGATGTPLITAGGNAAWCRHFA